MASSIRIFLGTKAKVRVARVDTLVAERIEDDVSNMGGAVETAEAMGNALARRVASLAQLLFDKGVMTEADLAALDMLPRDARLERDS